MIDPLGGPDSGIFNGTERVCSDGGKYKSVEKVLGEVKYDITDKERNKRRSLYAKVDIHEGDMFMEQNIGSYRPGFGLSPKYWDIILGKRSKRFIQRGDILTAEDIE